MKEVSALGHDQCGDGQPSLEGPSKQINALEKLRMGVGSGSAVTIIGRDTAVDYPLLEGLAGHVYTAANGESIYDEGKREVCVQEAGGQMKILRTRVGDVRKGLLAVAGLIDTGHEVIFDAERSVIHHKTTGKTTAMKRINDVFEVELDVVPFACSPFSRQMTPS